jgi:hypothetical protein
MAHIIAVLLIFIILAFYLLGVGWTLFGGAPPAWLTNTMAIVGAALATNFGAVLGIDLTQSRVKAGGWNRVKEFLKRIFSFLSGFDLKQMPEYAAGLYFAVLVIGSITLLFTPSNTGLAYSLFTSLIGAGIGALIHYLKRP